MKRIFNPRTGNFYPVREHSSKYDPDKRIRGLWKNDHGVHCKEGACNLNESGICVAPLYIDDFNPANCSKILIECVADDGDSIELPEKVIDKWTVREEE